MDSSPTGGPAVQVPTDLHALATAMIGTRAADNTALDSPGILAAADLVGRVGGTGFTVANSRGWYATADLPNRSISAGRTASAEEAAALLVWDLVTGSTCLGCRGVAVADMRRPAARPATGQAGGKACVWRRRGAQWIAGCVR